MTIKIRELTIKANIVEKNDMRERTSIQPTKEEQREHIGSLIQDFYNNELKKRRER